MISVCAIRVESRLIELRVRSEEDGRWQWSIEIAGGKVLCDGTVINKISAQLTSQRAFEQRLSRSGLGRFTPIAYTWKDLVR